MGVLIEGIDITGMVVQEDWDLGIRALSEPALDGSLIVYEGDKLYREFILVGGENWGWVTHQTLTAIFVLAKVRGATYSLDLEGDIFNVRFKTEDIPVISGELLIKRSNLEDTDYYKNVSIKLMGV